MIVKIFLILSIAFSLSTANGAVDGLVKIIQWSIKAPKKPLNYALKNNTHPKTGVRFNSSGYPVFKKVDTCDIGLSWISRGIDKLSYSNAQARQKHFAICSKSLYQKLTRNQVLKMKFSEHQTRQLKNGKTPNGYTWHHSENKNILELVDRAVHNKTAHSGGFSLHH